MADEEKNMLMQFLRSRKWKKYTRLQLASLIARGQFMPIGLTEESFKLFTDTIFETGSFTLLYPEEGLLERKFKN